MEERKSLLRWIKEHKKPLIYAGIGVGALILIVLGIKNRESIQAAWDLLWNAVEKPDTATSRTVPTASASVPRVSSPENITTARADTTTLPYGVSRHVRTLPKGQHASPEKIAEARRLSITLMEGQTWVDDYMKGGPAA